MPSDDLDLDPPISHAITDGWADFAELVLPGIGGSAHAEAHVAFHFGALCVLKIALHILAERPGEALALGMLDAELDESMKAHAVAVQ